MGKQKGTSLPRLWFQSHWRMCIWEICWVACQSWFAVTRQAGMNPLEYRQGCWTTAGGQCVGGRRNGTPGWCPQGEECGIGRSTAWRGLWETLLGKWVNTNNQGTSANRKPGTQNVYVERVAARWLPAPTGAAESLRDNAFWVRGWGQVPPDVLTPTLLIPQKPQESLLQCSPSTL